MQNPKEGTSLLDTGGHKVGQGVSVDGHKEAPPTMEGQKEQKISGKAWGRVGKLISCKSEYPTSVFFILGTEFCERFSFYGMKAILVIYMSQWLGFSDDRATAYFHGFSMLCYFTPLFGGMLADGWIGKYRTILYLSFIYCAGNIIMSFTALPPAEVVGPLIALLLISLGTGGIKPCVSAFGGDQFTSGQEKQLNQFFSVFYFAINVGSLLSMLLTPILRSDIHCYGNSCYPVAFGVPAILMILALVLFILGRNQYKVYPPPGNVVGQMISAIGRALKNKFSSKEPRLHWLDYADDKYEPKFLEDVRSALRVMVMFVPLPIFWALFDQQGSRWTLQAIQMDGDLGALGHMKPDQMQAINPVLIILLIPVFETAVYPLLDKCNIPNRPLQRMTVGMLLAAGAFVMAGFLQLKIDNTLDKPISSTESELRFINAAPCPIVIEGDIPLPQILDKPLYVSHGTDRETLPAGNYTVTISAIADNKTDLCGSLSGQKGATLDLTLQAELAHFVVAAVEDGELVAKKFSYERRKPEKGGALVSLIYTGPALLDYQVVTLKSVRKGFHYEFNVTNFDDTPFKELEPLVYQIFVPINETSDTTLMNDLRLESGGMYTVVIQPNVSFFHQLQMVDYVDVDPNSVSILWQVPQYCIITTGEVLFSVSGLQFAYSQAPVSMKSVLQAGWLMTVAFGNLIVVIVAEGQFVKDQFMEFFLFAALTVVITLIFAIMAYFYKYLRHEREYHDISEADESGLVADETAVSSMEDGAPITPDEPLEQGKDPQGESQI